MTPKAGSPPRQAVRHRRVFLPVLAALATLAWLVLWAWARSPYGRYLEHGDWTVSGPAAFLCQAVPAGGVIVPAVLYAVAWILMTMAMMLPTTLPLFNAFDRLTSGRPDHARLLVMLGLGYMRCGAPSGCWPTVCTAQCWPCSPARRRWPGMAG